MTISIQSSNPALAALETLALQQGGAANTGTATSNVQATPASAADESAAAILDVSSGAGASPGGASSLADGASAADAAVTAGASIETLLAQMQQDALTAADPGTSSADRASLDAGFQSDMATISQAVAGASVGGLNLIDGSAGSGTTASLGGINLTLGGPLIGLSSDASLSDPTSAAAIAGQLGAAVDNVSQAVGQIAAQGQAIETHLSLVAQAGLALQPGVSGAVNGSLDADGARLAALQVQQQLSTSSAPLASQSQGILALFR